jgi:hypothetical protein
MIKNEIRNDRKGQRAADVNEVVTWGELPERYMGKPDFEI